MKRRSLALGLLVVLAAFLFWWFWPPSDITSSIETAWQEAVPKVADIHDRVVSPNPEKREWFVGFLERRATVEVPQWWRNALMDARWGMGGYFFPPEVKGLDYHTTGERFKAPLGTTLERNGDTFILRTGEDLISLPDGVVGTRPDGQMGVPCDCHSALFTPTRCYVAAHMDIATDFLLHCIDRSSGKRLWKKEIEWRGVDGSLVNPRVWVSIHEKGHRVFVFCLGTHDGLHVEGCRASDGTSFLSFSGGWWGGSRKGFRGRE